MFTLQTVDAKQERRPKTADRAGEPPAESEREGRIETKPESPAKRRRGRPKKAEPTIAVMLHIRPATRSWLKRQAFETERTMSEIVDALVAAAGSECPEK